MYRYPILVFIHSFLFVEAPGFHLTPFLICFLIPLCKISLHHFLHSFVDAELLLLQELLSLYLNYHRIVLFIEDGRFIPGIYLGPMFLYLALKLLQQSLSLKIVNSE
jgi:hypothetical protein